MRGCYYHIRSYEYNNSTSINLNRRTHIMALKNLFGWNHEAHAAPASACGSACGAGDPKPTEEPKPSACGSACGAGDPK